MKEHSSDSISVGTVAVQYTQTSVACSLGVFLQPGQETRLIPSPTIAFPIVMLGVKCTHDEVVFAFDEGAIAGPHQCGGIAGLCAPMIGLTAIGVVGLLAAWATSGHGLRSLPHRAESTSTPPWFAWSYM